MLATTVPFYNISALCHINKKQIYHPSERSKSRMQRFEEPMRLASRSLATSAIAYVFDDTTLLM